MSDFFYPKKSNWIRKTTSSFIALAFLLSLIFGPATGVNAQYISNLPKPGEMVLLSPAFQPPVLKGMTLHPENPLQFDFIVDRGQDKLSGDALKGETQKLLKYFLAAMTIPDNDSWVNLSPYEGDRIIPDMLGSTDMGKQMLEQDYLLKQLSASLTNPQEEIGKKFWDTVYKKAYEKFGSTSVPINTFNKVWIVPDRALILEEDGYVFIGESHLKVMLDQDYTSLKENLKSEKFGAKGISQDKVEALSEVSSEVVRQVILPELEKEINEGKNFAAVRQIYHSVILATWYKQNLKNSLLGKIYVDKSKIAGVNIGEKDLKQKVYEQYLAAFRKGVYNLIKEDYDLASKETLPRKYFSGGLNFLLAGETITTIKLAAGRSSMELAGTAAQTAGFKLNPIIADLRSAIDGSRFASASVIAAEQQEAPVVAQVASAGVVAGKLFDQGSLDIIDAQSISMGARHILSTGPDAVREFRSFVAEISSKKDLISRQVRNRLLYISAEGGEIRFYLLGIWKKMQKDYPQRAPIAFVEQLKKIDQVLVALADQPSVKTEENANNVRQMMLENEYQQWYKLSDLSNNVMPVILARFQSAMVRQTLGHLISDIVAQGENEYVRGLYKSEEHYLDDQRALEVFVNWLLNDIGPKIDSARQGGRIRPGNADLITWDSHHVGNVSEQNKGKTVKISLFPTAGNPMQLAHLGQILADIAYEETDFGLIILQGTDTRKDDLSPMEVRVQILQQSILGNMYPLIRLSRINEDGLGLNGEVNALRLAAMNPEINLEMHYMHGLDHLFRSVYRLKGLSALAQTAAPHVFFPDADIFKQNVRENALSAVLGMMSYYNKKENLYTPEQMEKITEALVDAVLGLEESGADIKKLDFDMFSQALGKISLDKVLKDSLLKDKGKVLEKFFFAEPIVDTISFFENARKTPVQISTGETFGFSPNLKITLTVLEREGLDNTKDIAGIDPITIKAVVVPVTPGFGDAAATGIRKDARFLWTMGSIRLAMFSLIGDGKLKIPSISADQAREFITVITAKEALYRADVIARLAQGTEMRFDIDHEMGSRTVIAIGLDKERIRHVLYTVGLRPIGEEERFWTIPVASSPLGQEQVASSANVVANEAAQSAPAVGQATVRILLPRTVAFPLEKLFKANGYNVVVPPNETARAEAINSFQSNGNVSNGPVILGDPSSNLGLAEQLLRKGVTVAFYSADGLDFMSDDIARLKKDFGLIVQSSQRDPKRSKYNPQEALLNAIIEKAPANVQTLVKDGETTLRIDPNQLIPGQEGQQAPSVELQLGGKGVIKLSFERKERLDPRGNEVIEVGVGDGNSVSNFSFIRKPSAAFFESDGHQGETQKIFGFNLAVNKENGYFMITPINIMKEPPSLSGTVKYNTASSTITLTDTNPVSLLVNGLSTESKIIVGEGTAVIASYFVEWGLNSDDGSHYIKNVWKWNQETSKLEPIARDIGGVEHFTDSGILADYFTISFDSQSVGEQILKLQSKSTKPITITGIGESTVLASAGVTENKVGGIDFDPTLLNLQIKRNGRGVPLPLPEQNLENINIDGLYPVIINMQPATIQNFPFLISADKNEKVPELSMR